VLSIETGPECGYTFVAGSLLDSPIQISHSIIISSSQRRLGSRTVPTSHRGRPGFQPSLEWQI